MKPEASESKALSPTSDAAAAGKIRDVSVVFIHGFLDEGSLWQPVMDRLAAVGITSVAPDLRGMGTRAAAPGPFTLERLAEDVVSAFENFGGPLVLVGHSMGAQIAELVAAALPAQVSAMMLLTPVPLGGLAMPDEIAAQMRSLGGDTEAQRQLRRQFAGRHAEGVIGELIEVGMKVRVESARALFEAWRAGDPSGDGKSSFEGPVLIAGGAEDAFITLALIESMVSPRFRKASTVLIPEAGHWPHVERPSVVAQLLTDFIAELAGPAYR